MGIVEDTAQVENPSQSMRSDGATTHFEGRPAKNPASWAGKGGAGSRSACVHVKLASERARATLWEASAGHTRAKTKSLGGLSQPKH